MISQSQPESFSISSSRHILGTRVDAISYAEVCDRVQSAVLSKKSSYIVAANVHVIMTAFWNSKYFQILKSAEIVTPDGMPLAWGLRRLGIRRQPRVYGPDLMLALCNHAAEYNLSIYLYGGTAYTLEELSINLEQKFPKLSIVGMHSPPFRPLTPKEELQDIERIRRTGAAIVLVGLGCPKQEEWMHRQFGKLSAGMVGVGAAFRFHSGEVKQAPAWMMISGLDIFLQILPLYSCLDYN